MVELTRLVVVRPSAAMSSVPHAIDGAVSAVRPMIGRIAVHRWFVGIWQIPDLQKDRCRRSLGCCLLGIICGRHRLRQAGNLGVSPQRQQTMQPVLRYLEEPQERAYHQSRIEPKSPVLDILTVQKYFALHANEVAVGWKIDLCEARDAGSYGKPVSIAGDCFGEHTNKFGPFWPRANERHFSLEHVDKLRQFVQVKFTKESPNSGNSRILLLRPNRPGSRLRP